MTQIRMTTDERRAALQTARRDLENTIYTMAASLNLDIDGLDDITMIGGLWHDNELDIPTISPVDAEWPNYIRLQALCDRLGLVIEKLEGPSRIV